MTKTLEIIFDTRADEIVFDVSFQGKRYNAFRHFAEGSKFAADVRVTAERFGGFRYINSRQVFVTAFAIEGNEIGRLVTAFERQGYVVLVRGRTQVEHYEALPLAA